MIPRTLLFSALLAVSAFAPSGAYARVLAARIDPDNLQRVLVVRGAADTPTEFGVYDGPVVEVAPSPSGAVVGVLAVLPPTDRRSGRLFRLYLSDSTGTTFRMIDHVQKFEFSPDDRFVAVIRGNGYEGGPGFFPESTEIFGLAEPDIGPVEGLQKATDVRWSTFKDDGLVLLARVYEGQRSIVEYVINTGVVVPTDFRGLNFSPDGRFYYLTPAESLRADLCEAGQARDSCVRVYRRSELEALALDLPPAMRRTLGWADNRRIILANERNHDCQLFDVQSKRSSEAFASVDWRWNTVPGVVMRRPSADANFRKLGKPQLRTLAQ